MSGRRLPVTRRGLSLLCGLVVLGIGAFLFSTGGFAQKSDRLDVTTSSGTHRFTIEWALTEAERERGLMHRTEMAEDHGMLFDFGREQPVYFWMKDTPLSLDMVFATEDGTVYRIAKKVRPLSEDLVPSGAPVRYVLELVAGTADRIALRPGDRLEIPPAPRRSRK